MIQSCADVISQSGVDSQRGLDVMLERRVRNARHRPQPNMQPAPLLVARPLPDTQPDARDCLTYLHECRSFIERGFLERASDAEAQGRLVRMDAACPVQAVLL